MTTKDEILFLKNKEQSFKSIISNVDLRAKEHSNFNLNQTTNSFDISAVHSYSKSSVDKQFVTNPTVTHKYEEKQRLQSLCKPSNIDLCSKICNLSDKEETKKRWKHDINSSRSTSSTLSLHIAAYENSHGNNEAFEMKKEKSYSVKKWINTKQTFIGSASDTRMTYEFPRQQEQAEITNPEVMQFKASQRLLSPSQSSASNQGDNEKFASQGKRERPSHYSALGDQHHSFQSMPNYSPSNQKYVHPSNSNSSTVMQTEMELVVWPSDFGLASLDTGCLQSMVAAKIAAAPVKFRFSTNPGESPSGTLPLLIHGDTKLTNFEDIAEHLRNLKQEVVLDGELTPNQRVEFFAYASYLRSRLYPALLHTLWVDNYNYNNVTHHWYTSKLYFPWNLFYLEKRRKFAQNYLKTVGKGEAELVKEALQTLNLLSSKLGDNKYFCGDKPCSVDALIFGYLAPLLKLPLPSDRIYLHLSSLPNLSRFVESIICIYLPLPDELIRQQNIEKQAWEKRKSKAQRTAEESRLRKEQKRNETEQSNASSLRDTILFGMGALTLSVLFAVHTGMISFISEEDDKLDVE